jgi:3',5'-cyclic AMP phosphodiesterase CpdA
MLLAQITDCHIRVPGELLYGAVDTAPYLERAVAALNALDPRPDLVLLTGDLVDRGSRAEYERLRVLLAPLTLPFRMIPGNHDSRANLAAAFPEHGYLRGDDGFGHWTLDDAPLRLVALDSSEPGVVGGVLCAARLDWLERRLSKAPARPTLVLIHHPPIVTGISHMDAYGFRGVEAFAEIVRGHAQVERVIAGHVHRAMTKRWAGTVVTTCPSTAHQFALDLRPGVPAAYALEPPCLQLHDWHEGAGLMTHTLPIGDYPPRPLRPKPAA